MEPWDEPPSLDERESENIDDAIDEPTPVPTDEPTAEEINDTS